MVEWVMIRIVKNRQSDAFVDELQAERLRSSEQNCRYGIDADY